MKIVIKSKSENPHVTIDGKIMSMKDFEKIKDSIPAMTRAPPVVYTKPTLLKRVKGMFTALCARLAKFMSFTGFFK